MDIKVDDEHIIEGIYHVSSQTKSLRSKRKIAEFDGLSSLFDKISGPSKLSRGLREELFREIDLLRGNFINIIAQLNKPALDSIIDFIYREGCEYESLRRKIPRQVKEIPTVLVIGDEFALHDHKQCILQKSLESLDTHNVFCMVEPDWFKSADGLVKSIATGILTNWITKSSRKKNGIKFSELTEGRIHSLDTICRLYMKHSSTVATFVVFIPEITAANIPIISTFILMCREYIEHVPIVLILGFTSCVETFYHYMPQSAISSLKIKKVSLKSPDGCLDVLVDELLIKRLDGFKFSPAVLKHLFYISRSYNSSVGFILHQWTRLLVDYYCNNPASLLIHYCKQPQERRVSSPEENVEFLRYWCVPVRILIENLATTSPMLASSLLLKDESFVDYVLKCLSELELRNKKISIGMEFLKILSRFLLNRTNIQILEFYVELLEGRLSIDSHHISMIIKCLDDASLNTLSMCVLACIELIDQVKEIAGFAEIASSLAILAIKIKLNNQVSRCDPNTKSRRSERLITLSMVRQSSDILPKNKIVITEDGPHGTGTSIPVRDFRDDFKHIMKHIFRVTFETPMNYPLHELVYCYDLKPLNETIFTSVLDSILDSLCTKKPTLFQSQNIHNTIKKNKFQRNQPPALFVNPAISSTVDICMKNSRVFNLADIYSSLSKKVATGKDYLRLLVTASILELKHIGIIKITPSKPWLATRMTI